MRLGLPLFAGLLLTGFAAMPASAGGRAPGKCQLSLTASADDSFEQAGYDSSPARLSSLVALTRDRLAAAARRLCAQGVLRPADLARLHEMVVQNGEGATEPVIYGDVLMGPSFFVFQYAFQNGGPPEPSAFEDALRCWKYPKRAGCYED
jgi:hypothetical protein